MTGSFTTNNAFTALTGADITASAVGTYLGQTYTLGNSTDQSGLPGFIQLTLNPISDPNTSQLRLVFSSNLTGSGATLTNSSFEHEFAGGNRFVQSGSVAPAVSGVPEPASAPLMLAGLLAAAIAGLGVKRGKRLVSARN